MLTELWGESKSSCATSVNNRPAFSPWSIISRIMSHWWLSLQSSTLWRLSDVGTPEKHSIFEVKDSDEEKGERQRGVSAVEIRDEA